ncbi:ATP synthase subunit delta [Flavobacteriaceae bacterium UJ101]|nr:ATP synthase subunit delta [Flavobacteriaceae bacterium UJ101]
MQQGSRAAKRYAKGLLLFAQETNQEDLIYEEMNNVHEVVKESRDLRNFLSTPTIDIKKKSVIAKESLKGLSELTLKFVDLLISHKRADLLGVAAKEYVTLYDFQRQIEAVNITTAVEVSDDTIQKILTKVQSLIGNRQLKVNKKVDASLIGGFIVRVGDKQIDNSIKSKLYSLTQEFSDNHYIPKF